MSPIPLVLSMFLFTPPTFALRDIATPTVGPASGPSLASWSNLMFGRCAETFAAQLKLPNADATAVAEQLCSHARIFWPFVEMQDFEGFTRWSPGTPAAKLPPLVIYLVGPSAVANARALHAIRGVLYPAPSGPVDWSFADEIVDARRASDVATPDALIIRLDACEAPLASLH